MTRSVFFQAVRRNHQRSILKYYKDLKVWQKSYDLCLEICRITANFPKEERYGLTSQIRKSVVSIPYEYSRNRKNVKSTDKVFRKQTLESLAPGTLEPSSPTKLEKNQKNKVHLPKSWAMKRIQWGQGLLWAEA